MTLRVRARRVAFVLVAALACGGFVAIAPAGAQPDVGTQVTASGGVTIKVTPKLIGPQQEAWVFAVVMDTHSQDLGDDLLQTTVLVADDGRELKPGAWQGAAAGGHHREGTLEFAAPKPLPKSIQLKMQRPDEPEARLFQWTF